MTRLHRRAASARARTRRLLLERLEERSLLASVSVSDAVLTEGHTGPAALTFTVSLSEESDQPVTLDYGTAGWSFG